MTANAEALARIDADLARRVAAYLDSSVTAPTSRALITDLIAVLVPEPKPVMPTSLDRAVEIDAARRAIQEQAPYDARCETRWQYEDRLAAAARDAVAAAHDHRAGSTDGGM